MVDGETTRIIAAGLREAVLSLAVRGGILFGLAFLVTRMGRSMGPERRHTVWLAVILLLTIIPVAQVTIPLVRLPVLDPPLPAASAGRVPVPFPPAPAPTAADPGRAPAGSGFGLAPDDNTDSGQEAGAPASWVPWALLGAWLAGVLAVAARPVWGRVALARLVRSPGSRPGPEGLLAALTEREGIRGVSTLAHPRVTAPFTFGILRPKIVLPPSWTRWSGERVEAVLLHEMAHLRRHDVRSECAALAACALAWFNPLAWMARAFLRREAELSCDQEVLARGIPRSGYAAALVEIARSAHGTTVLFGGTALAGRSMLRRRILEILSARPAQGARRTLRARMMAAALCALAPFLLLSVSLRGTDPLYGVWQGRSATRPYYDYRLALDENGRGQTTLDAVPGVPTSFARYVVDRKWKDSEGYSCYHVRARWSGMPFLVYTLVRIDPSGNQFEMTDSPTGYPEGFVGPPGSGEKHQLFVRR